jgi:hypothetical protein
MVGSDSWVARSHQHVSSRSHCSKTRSLSQCSPQKTLWNVLGLLSCQHLSKVQASSSKSELYRNETNRELTPQGF